MEENLERIKTVIFQAIVMILAFAIVGVALFVIEMDFNIRLYIINGSMMTTTFTIGSCFRTKYCKFELLMCDALIELINSKQVDKNKEIDGVIIYKIKSKYSLLAMKFSYFNSNGKIIINGPQFLTKIFRENKIENHITE